MISKLTPRHFYKGLLEQLGCESKFYRGDAKLWDYSVRNPFRPWNKYTLFALFSFLNDPNSF